MFISFVLAEANTSATSALLQLRAQLLRSGVVEVQRYAGILLLELFADLVEGIGQRGRGKYGEFLFGGGACAGADVAGAVVGAGVAALVQAAASKPMTSTIDRSLNGRMSSSP